MSADFDSEAVATAEAAVSLAMALVKDQVPELPDDILERELSELGGADTVRDPRVEIWRDPVKKFVKEYDFVEGSLGGALSVATMSLPPTRSPKAT